MVEKSGSKTNRRLFSVETIRFLREVHTQNSREWFERNRDVYQSHLLGPMQEMVIYLNEAMLDIDPRFETRPQVNRTISKIYRDTRFSRDKSLFKRAAWLVFKRPSPDWTRHPAFFFEITPDFYRYGMGYYQAVRATMDALRRRIDDNPSGFDRIIKPIMKSGWFTLEGDSFKRPLPCTHGPQIAQWYQKKSFYLTHHRSVDKDLFSPRLAETVKKRFKALKPLYQLLMIEETQGNASP